MRIEKGIITSKQLTFMVIGLVQGSVLTLSFVYGITKQDTWIAVVTGLILTLVMVYIYTSIMNIFPKRNIIEINNKVFGRVIGTFISLIYIYHLFLVVPRNLRFIGDFVKQDLLIETPFLVIITVFTLICAYAVKSGLEVIARCATILVILSFAIAITIVTLIFKEVHLTNLLPMFQINLKEFIQGTHIIFAIPFSEVILFLMIAPYTDEPIKIRKSLFTGMIISGLYVCYISLRNIATLGPITYNSAFPSYKEVSLIEVGNVLTRIDVMVAVFFFLTLFTKVCFFYYTSVLAIAHVLNLREYKFLVLPCGIIAICFTFTMFNSLIDEIDIGSNIYPFYSFIIEAIIPILTLIIAKLRKMPRKLV